MLAFRNGTLAHKLRDFHARYGDTIRVAPNELSFIRPDAIHEIYAKRPNASFKTLPKDPVRQPPPQPGTPVSLLEATDLDHTRIRKGWSPSFSMSSLSAQEPLIKAYIDALITQLTGYVNQDRLVDLQQWYSFCTFDVITALSFGEDLRCTELGRYHDWLALLVYSVKAKVQIAACRFYPALYSLLMSFMSSKAKSILAKHLAFTKEKVTARLAAHTDHPDFFSNLHRGDLSVDEIVTNSATMIFAGSHTVQSTLTGITLCLLDNPIALKRVTEEVRAEFSDSREITYRKLQLLPYLGAVVQEGMRLTSPVPLGLTRMIPEGGSIICGIPLPGGVSPSFLQSLEMYRCLRPPQTIVSYQMWAACTSSRNFAKAGEFHPERFLAASHNTQFAADELDAVQPFLAGPRDCIGQNLARVEILMIIAHMLYHFDVTAPQGTFKWENQETYAVWTRTPLMVKLSKRV